MPTPTIIIDVLLTLLCAGFYIPVHGVEVVDLSCPPGYTVRGQAAYTEYQRDFKTEYKQNFKDVSNNFLFCIICLAESYAKESLDVCMSRDVFKTPKLEAAGNDSASYLRAFLYTYTDQTPNANWFSLSRVETGWSYGDMKAAAICGITYNSSIAAVNTSLSDLAGLGQVKPCHKAQVAPSIKVLNAVICPDPKMRLGGILHNGVTGSCGLCYSSSSESSRNAVYVCRKIIEPRINVFNIYYRCLMEPCEKDFDLSGRRPGNDVGNASYCGFEVELFGRKVDGEDFVPNTTIIGCDEILKGGYFGIAGGGMDVLHYAIIFTVSLCVVLVIVLIIILFRKKKRSSADKAEKTVDEYVVQNVYYE